MLHTSPSCRCCQGGCTRRKAWQAQKIIALSYTFSFINRVRSQQLHFVSWKKVSVENSPGFADQRGILGESQFSWMSRVTCVPLTQVSILPLLTKAVTMQLDLGWTLVALYYVLKEKERNFQSHFQS